MNPALAASGSGGLAGAAVVLFNAALSHFGLTFTPEVVAAEVTLATALAGVGAHYLTVPASDVPPAAVPAPAPEAKP